MSEAMLSRSTLEEPPRLKCYRLHEHALELIPGGSRRQWMDETSKRFAYRCTPMVIANTTGWEILCPVDISATWGGGIEPDRLSISFEAGDPPCYPLACSHFGHGILTFQPGYVFRTSPGWAIWARGAPNVNKVGIFPLEGVIETEWLPFSFTMNWRFSTPGTVKFRRGEPLCFITLVPHKAIDDVAPILANIWDDPKAHAEHEKWLVSRRDFNAGLVDPNSAEARSGWQRKYLQAFGAPPETYHVTKRKLQSPKPIIT